MGKQVDLKERLFKVRTANIYNSQKRRAKADGQELDYTLEALRNIVQGQLEEGECPYCRCLLKIQNLSVDHDEPLSRGGEHRLHNLDVVCEKCNLAKGILTGQEYVELLRVLNGWPASVRQDVLGRLRAGGRFRR